MPLKKQLYADNEIPIYDEAVVYQRGEYWQMCMWLAKEKKYARFSLRTRNRDTAIDKAKKHYHELMAQQLAGKTYFSKTAKQGEEKYSKQREKDAEAEPAIDSRQETMDYRREIDGLRALAVLPVILFHAGFETFSGGFIGVDVFFVISGYLITTIILAELEQGKFSIVNFYERRARRILPALFLVMLVCIPFASIWFFTNQIRDLSQSFVAVSVFASNILFWRESAYFDTAAELKPLLHTWSLSVEEQYYVLFPLFLMLFWKLGKRWILVMLGLVFVASLAAAQWAAYAEPALAFYLLPTRGWELLIGAFAAFYLSQANRNGFGKGLSEFGGWLGVALILYAVFAYSKATPFPGFYALVPGLGTVFIILFATQQTTVGRFVGNKVFVGIGLISYSAYLWHQPLLAFIKFRNFGEIDRISTSLIVVATFILAYLTLRYIENPVRQKKYFVTSSSLFVFSASAILVFVAVGLYGNSTNFLGKRSTPKFLQEYEEKTDYVADNFFLIAESWDLQKEINGIPFFGVDNIAKDKELLFDLSGDKKKLLVVGNSHSVDFFNVLYFSKKISTKYQLARFGVQIRNIDDEFFLSPNYLSSDVVVYCSLMSEGDEDAIERVIAKSVKDGKKVFVCQNIFTWMERANFTKLDKLIVDGLRNGIAVEKLSMEINDRYSSDYLSSRYIDEDRREYAFRFSKRLKQISQTHNFGIIDRMDYVCPAKKCKLVSESLGKYFFDMGHHTMGGARFFSTVIDSGNALDGLVVVN
jgi:peptidoglycan/LPS O-acetylase OafA/YrhL